MHVIAEKGELVAPHDLRLIERRAWSEALHEVLGMGQRAEELPSP
jgi:hypothetical protein